MWRDLRHAVAGLWRSPEFTSRVLGPALVIGQVAISLVLLCTAALPGVARVAVAFRAPLSLSGGGFSKPLFLDGPRIDRDAALFDARTRCAS